MHRDLFDETRILQLPTRLKKKRLKIAPPEFFVSLKPENISKEQIEKKPELIEKQVDVISKPIENKELVTVQYPINEKKIVSNQSIVKTDFSGLSIKSFLEKKEEIPTENLQELSSDDFSEMDLTNAWADFLKISKSKVNTASFSVLENIKPEKIDSQTIKVVSPSYSSQSEFDEVRNDFMIFLRERLNNHHLKIVYELKEDITATPVLSKEDIYKIMLKKNKNLETLRKNLGLDFND